MLPAVVRIITGRAVLLHSAACSHCMHACLRAPPAAASYAPYQVADEPPALSISRRDALALDAEWADMLVARGAGRLGTLTDMEQLRARGFAWDSDPEEEQREGLHIQLPNGRSMHIPSGL